MINTFRIRSCPLQCQSGTVDRFISSLIRARCLLTYSPPDCDSVLLYVGIVSLFYSILYCGCCYRWHNSQWLEMVENRAVEEEMVGYGGAPGPDDSLDPFIQGTEALDRPEYMFAGMF